MRQVNRLIRRRADHFGVPKGFIAAFAGLDLSNLDKAWEDGKGFSLPTAVKAGAAIIAKASQRYDTLEGCDRRMLETLIDEIIAAYVADHLGR